MDKMKKDFINTIDLLIKETVQKIEEKKKNPKIIGTQALFQTILNELNKMRGEVLMNRLPDKEDRFVIYEEYIIDYWGIRTTYGNKLLDVANTYINRL